MPSLKSKGSGEQRGAPSLETVTHGCWVILARGTHLPGLLPSPPPQSRVLSLVWGGVSSRRSQEQEMGGARGRAVLTQLYPALQTSNPKSLAEIPPPSRSLPLRGWHPPKGLYP